MSDRLHKNLTGQYGFAVDADRLATLANLGLSAVTSASTLTITDSTADEHEKIFTIKSAGGNVTVASLADDGTAPVDLVTITAAGFLTATGTIQGATVHSTGAVTAVGAVTGASAAITGAITSASLAATGAVTSASVAATGAVTSASVAATGAVSGATLAATGATTLGTSVQAAASTTKFAGHATMVAGTIAITDATTATADAIVITPHFAPAGRLSVSISNGVSFTINSTDAGDAGVVSWIKVHLT